MASFEKSLQIGIALDPIHLGTGGTRIGRVDLTIVRDPVTQLPKIPGSSLAGVYRTYVAMRYEEERQSGQQFQGRNKPFYPDCVGLGMDTTHGHCREPDCPVCTVFGFATAQGGGFAGLASFSDAHVLLFPVPTRQGPMWVTAPMMLDTIGITVNGLHENAAYLKSKGNPLNLGWLLLETCKYGQMDDIQKKLENLGIPDYMRNRLALVPDRLFAHIVNSNLEVRTSVSIDPATGTAEDKALFSYEALPRGTVLLWEIIAKNPAHFKVGGQPITAVSNPESVRKVAQEAHPYLEHLGIGGMGTRGMGRVCVKHPGEEAGSAEESTPSGNEINESQ
ncbi:MAG: type III-B CRISPR module RAMP protein Cmr4 [Bacteroidetes bacterium]|nr:MAG: type III-B CRISPR module RAMP protein Cmr4 [Bacteroidota bacterium]